MATQKHSTDLPLTNRNVAIPEAFMSIDGASDDQLQDSLFQAIWLARACTAALASVESEEHRGALGFLADGLFEQIDAKTGELRERRIRSSD